MIASGMSAAGAVMSMQSAPERRRPGQLALVAIAAAVAMLVTLPRVGVAATFERPVTEMRSPRQHPTRRRVASWFPRLRNVPIFARFARSARGHSSAARFDGQRDPSTHRPPRGQSRTPRRKAALGMLTLPALFLAGCVNIMGPPLDRLEPYVFRAREITEPFFLLPKVHRQGADVHDPRTMTVAYMPEKRDLMGDAIVDALRSHMAKGTSSKVAISTEVHQTAVPGANEQLNVHPLYVDGHLTPFGVTAVRRIIAITYFPGDEAPLDPTTKRAVAAAIERALLETGAVPNSDARVGGADMTRRGWQSPTVPTGGRVR